MEKGWFIKEGQNWPMEFVMVLANRAFDDMKQKSYELLQKEWMKKMNMDDDEESEAEQENDTPKPVPTAPYRTDKGNKSSDPSTRAEISSASKEKDSVLIVTEDDPFEWDMRMRANNLRLRMDNLMHR
jgi:hypothetical protein